MFEFRQDTAIIQGACLSAKRQLQQTAEVPSQGLCGLTGNELRIVTELVSSAVALAKRGSWAPEREKPDALLTDIRAHATVFYTVLRSAGITCATADKYYAAISGIFPVMDWSLYVALLASCNWCEFFLECVNDLPDKVAARVLENLLVVAKKNEENCDYFIGSKVLQAIMQKLLGFKLAPKHGDLHEVLPEFCFSFACVPSNSSFCAKEVASSATREEMSNGSESGSETSKLSTFSDLLSAALIFKTEEVDEAEVLKVFLYGLFCFLDISSQVKPGHPQNFNLVVPLVQRVLNCVQSDKSIEQITLALSKLCASSIRKESVLTYVSWDVDIAYLVFLVYGGWNEVKYYLESHDTTDQEPIISMFDETVQRLEQLLPLCTENLSSEQFLDALIFIADNRLIGMNYSLATFIRHPHILEKEKVVACLKRNMPQPVKKSLTYPLLKAIMEQPLSQKDHLVPIFFHAVKGLSVLEQQYILQHFLSTYSLSENLKQQNFVKEMSPILNQTVNAEQAEEQIILLCLQSPKECVSIIVQQAVKGNSGQIAVLTKMLKLLSAVCAFRKPREASLLLNELKPYFSSTSLIPQQLKNIKILTEELLQVLEDKDGLKPSELLTQCIFPCINLELSVVSMSFPLEVLEIVFSTTHSMRRTSWLSDLNVPAFLIYMGKIIDFCITERSGSLKERVVSILDLLYEFQQLEQEGNHHIPVYKGIDLWIETHLRSLNPVIPLYIEKCIAKYTSQMLLKADASGSLTLMWLSCCISGRRLETPLKELISENCDSNHTFLVVFLTKILPNLSQKEWFHSALLVEDYLEHLTVNSDEIEQLDMLDKNLRFPKSIEIFVDALLLLRTCDGISLDWSYMVSSFAKVLSTQMCNQGQELHPKTFATLFLQLCRLASHLEEIHLELITVPLLDIFKIMKKLPCVMDSSTGFSSCLYAAVCAMPDSVTRSNVLASMKSF